MKILKKITVKAVTGAKPDIEKVIEADKAGKRLAVMDVLGIASSFSEGQTTLPDGKVSVWHKLIGQFKAIDCATGELSVAGVAILPGPGNDLVRGALGGDTKSVEFAFRVYLKRDKDAATGYIYEVESLVPMKDSDPLAALTSQVAKAQVAQLPAPAASAAPAATAKGGRR